MSMSNPKFSNWQPSNFKTAKEQSVHSDSDIGSLNSFDPEPPRHSEMIKNQIE